MRSNIKKILEALTKSAPQRLLLDFEGLKSDEVEFTSPADLEYNCIAHAAGDSEKWWWAGGVSNNDCYWVEGISRKTTLENFILAFETLGYEPCENADFNSSFEKVAIFVSTSDKTDEFGEFIPKETPTHMARQLPNGKWTSKLGKDVDISHNSLQSIEGKIYGEVKQILKRPK